MRPKSIVLWTTLLLILGVANATIFQKEMTIVTGKTVYLQLAPVDPRSLIQGDYMTLRYALANEDWRSSAPGIGKIVIGLDENKVAYFIRVYDGYSDLHDGELLLRYRINDSGVQFSAESFFFQEGHAAYYDNARYGELKVDRDGNAVLLGLRDSNFEKLGP